MARRRSIAAAAWLGPADAQSRRWGRRGPLAPTCYTRRHLHPMRHVARPPMADLAGPSAYLPQPPPLVGREREQAMLRDALAAALAGRGSLMLIGGEAGIGKTALAEATLAEATVQGALVLVGRCYDLAETPPYGPWIQLFGHLPVDPTL